MEAKKQETRTDPKFLNATSTLNPRKHGQKKKKTTSSHTRG